MSLCSSDCAVSLGRLAWLISVVCTLARVVGVCVCVCVCVGVCVCVWQASDLSARTHLPGTPKPLPGYVWAGIAAAGLT